MSELILRRWTKEDEAILSTITASGRPDLRGINSPTTHTCVCLEAGKIVGIAMGTAPKGGTIASLDFARSLIAGRDDIMLALAEWHNTNAIALGYKEASIVIPYTGQCTNVRTTASLKTFIGGKVAVSFVPEGKVMTTGKVSAERLQSMDLQAAAKSLATALDAMGCVRKTDA
jgi:hypothetical protein